MKKLLFTFNFALIAFFAAAQPFEATDPGTELTYGIFDADGQQTGYRKVRVVSVQEKEQDRRTVILRIGEFDLEGNPILDPATGIERIPPVYSFHVNANGDVATSYEALFGTHGEYLEAAAGNGIMVGGETDFGILARPDVGQKYTGSRSWDRISNNVRVHGELKLVTTYAGTEKMVVPAGTFEVQRIGIDADHISGLGDGRKSIEKRFVDLRAPGIGSVKRGMVDEKGRFTDGYIELLKIEK